MNAGIGIKALNLKANAFGQVVLTNVGTLGHEEGFAPIPTLTHCCIVVCQGKIAKRPVVVDDQIVIRDMMTCVITVDHRFGDAAVIGQLLQIIKDYLQDPESFDLNKYPQIPFYEEMKKKV